MVCDTVAYEIGERAKIRGNSLQLSAQCFGGAALPVRPAHRQASGARWRHRAGRSCVSRNGARAARCEPAPLRTRSPAPQPVAAPAVRRVGPGGNFWSLLQRAIKGTYVGVEPFHLFPYLDEEAFRYNNRKDDDGGRFLEVLRSIVGQRLTYEESIGDEAAVAVPA
jgi:hypothetical protein